MNTKKYLRDDIAGILLTDETLKDYVISIISASTSIKKEDIKDLKLITPRINSNTNIKYSEVDAVYESSDNIINIEVNYNESKLSIAKNNRYVYHLILRQVKKGDIDLYKKVWQININNYDYFKKGEFIYHSYIMDEKYHECRDDGVEIIDINLAYLEKLSYNEIKKEGTNSLIRLLYIMLCEDKEERVKLYKSDRIMDKVNDKIDELTEEFDSILFYNKEEFRKAESEELGIEKGRKEREKEIAKKMLEENMSLELISKLTGLSKEEIEELK